LSTPAKKEDQGDNYTERKKQAAQWPGGLKIDRKKSKHMNIWGIF
jgi:hypothetical protein